MVIKLPPFFRTTFPFQCRRTVFVLLTVVFLGLPTQAQEESNPYVRYDVPFQNLLKFNRFLINPTFSSIREDKSYVNFFHRSQSADFDNNRQNYFLSYSGRLNDRVGLGFSLYNQQEGVISNAHIIWNVHTKCQTTFTPQPDTVGIIGHYA